MEDKDSDESECVSSRDTSVPFGQWTKEQVCGWLEDFGLGQYVNLTRQWVESGQTLLSATPQDFEKVRERNPGKMCTTDTEDFKAPLRRIQSIDRPSSLSSGDEDEEPAAQKEAATGPESIFHQGGGEVLGAGLHLGCP